MATFSYPATIQEKLAYACRIMARSNLSDAIWGHVSLREPGAETFWMKPSTFGLEEIMPEHMIEVSFEGKVVAGRNPLHIEFPIHSEIMRSREDALSVVHSHPVHSIAFCASGQPIRPISHEGILFSYPDIPYFEESTGLISSRELGHALAMRMGNHRAVFLRNHGVVTAGKTIEQSVAYTVMLERAAQLQLMTFSMEEVLSTPEHEVERKRNMIYSDSQLVAWWNYQCRQVGPLTALN